MKSKEKVSAKTEWVEPEGFNFVLDGLDHTITMIDKNRINVISIDKRDIVTNQTFPLKVFTEDLPKFEAKLHSLTNQIRQLQAEHKFTNERYRFTKAVLKHVEDINRNDS